MISFNNIPADLAVPLFYAEIDSSAAATGGNTLRRLIIGQANDDAIVDSPTLTLLSRTSDAIALAGEGSMLAAMSDIWRRGDPVGEVWGIAVRSRKVWRQRARSSWSARRPRPVCCRFTSRVDACA
jgi:phage tail sheath gpL-like